MIIEATLISIKEILIGVMGGLIGVLVEPSAQELAKTVETLISEII